MKLSTLLLYSLAFMATSCIPEEEERSFPIITNLENTVWENRTEELDGTIYYNVLTFDVENRGTMSRYQTTALDVPLSTKAFTYTYPLNENYGLTLSVDDGPRYDGYLVQKGNLQIDFKDVYVIQLFEVDGNGDTILGEDGKPQSSMMFWKE